MVETFFRCAAQKNINEERKHKLKIMTLTEHLDIEESFEAR